LVGSAEGSFSSGHGTKVAKPLSGLQILLLAIGTEPVWNLKGLCSHAVLALGLDELLLDGEVVGANEVEALRQHARLEIPAANARGVEHALRGWTASSSRSICLDLCAQAGTIKLIVGAPLASKLQWGHYAASFDSASPSGNISWLNRCAAISQ
jgi:hypothetical protein